MASRSSMLGADDPMDDKSTSGILIRGRVRPKGTTVGGLYGTITSINIGKVAGMILEIYVLRPDRSLFGLCKRFRSRAVNGSNGCFDADSFLRPRSFVDHFPHLYASRI